MSNVFDEKKAIRNFFFEYAHSIEGELLTMNAQRIDEYLHSDIFIGVASAATGIPESSFVDFAVSSVKEFGTLKKALKQ